MSNSIQNGTGGASGAQTATDQTTNLGDSVDDAVNDYETQNDGRRFELERRAADIEHKLKNPFTKLFSGRKLNQELDALHKDLNRYEAMGGDTTKIDALREKIQTLLNQIQQMNAADSSKGEDVSDGAQETHQDRQKKIETLEADLNTVGLRSDDRNEIMREIARLKNPVG